MIKRIIERIKKWIAFRSSDGALNYYRSKGIVIGVGSIIHYPNTVTIDVTRPELLTIGRNVLLHKGLTILTHDYASRVFVNLYSDFIPSHGRITIGDNVWFGQHCTVLKGVSIGDNCIIGYGSTVMHDIPANSVAVGCPARVICTVEQYYEKRKKQYVKEAAEYAKAIISTGREPKISDFSDDYPCFVDADNYMDYDYPYNKVFSAEKMETWKKKHKKIFNGFDDFMKYVSEN